MGEYVNSQNARFDKSHVSCGVLEVHHLPKNSRKTLFAIANALYNKANPRPAAFILFSDDMERKRGVKLADEMKHLPVTTEQLPNGEVRMISCGTVLESTTEINPKTGNKIKVWLFIVNHEGFRKWYQEELANRIVEESEGEE